MRIRTIKGVAYIEVPATNVCQGCAAWGNDDLCMELGDCEGLIFKLADFKFSKHSDGRVLCQGCVAERDAKLCGVLPRCVGGIYERIRA